MEDAISACKILHNYGPTICFLTGLEFKNTENNCDSNETLSILVSFK